MENKLNLDELKEQDVYSLSLFLLYKLSVIPKLSLVGELPYILDEDNLLKLCKYMGGKTITIPTVEELMDSMRTVLLYQMHVVEKRSWKESLSASGYLEKESTVADRKLKKLEEILSTYNVHTRSDYDS